MDNFYRMQIHTYTYIWACQSQEITSTRDKTRETKPAQDGNVESYHSSSPARDPDRGCRKAVKRRKRKRWWKRLTIEGERCREAT